jgi:hypothetical protein
VGAVLHAACEGNPPLQNLRVIWLVRVAFMESSDHCIYMTARPLLDRNGRVWNDFHNFADKTRQAA